MQQLDCKYSALRVLAADRLGPLVASLAEAGQQAPVLTVAGADGKAPVLIDGYRRVAALRRLGRDTCRVLQLELSERDALLMRHLMAASDRRSALEDGWLLRELADSHGLSQVELAQRLSRSPSWVCRRLGMVNDLPEVVQDLVRKGEVPAHSAMKVFVPLARANSGACMRLASTMAGQHWSAREVETLYQGWRKARGEQRAAIEAKPRLYCQAREATVEPLPVDDPQARDLVKGLTSLASAAWRVRTLARERTRAAGKLEPADVLAGLWNDTEERIAALRKVICDGLGFAAADPVAPEVPDAR
ncbi:MAG: ParB/RepB/Spo0J family partition protein [Myxococcota bacterium]